MPQSLCECLETPTESALGCWFLTCGDAVRFTKGIIAFVIANFAVGIAFQAGDVFREEVSEALEHPGFVQFLSWTLTSSFVFMYVVDIICLVYSLTSTPCCREYLFRERETERLRIRALQICMGPCCSSGCQVMVWITILLQVGLSYVYLLSGIFLRFLVGICTGGDAVISSFQGLLDSFTKNWAYQDDPWSPLNWFMGMDIEKYCVATQGASTATLTCFTGCLLSVFSQVLMMSVISEEKGRIESTFEDTSYEVQEDSGRRRRKSEDEDESSSSDSDYEADPRKKSQSLRIVNPNLPQGYQPGKTAGVRTFR